MWALVLALVILCCGWCSGGLEVSPIGPQIVVISLDGFGQHYLASYPGHFLPTLYSRGAYPEKFSNQFTTKTFPNHFSVATGVYEDVHGVVGNTVYDAALNATLDIHNQSLFTQNPSLIPIWTLNELVGGHSGCIMWPGCGFPYRNKNVTFFEPFRHSADLRGEMYRVVEWLTNATTPANLVMVYHEQPDLIGHAYGPDSPQVLAELKKIDSALQYFFHELEIFGLRDIVDVIILSDHGMMSVKERDIVDLSALVDTSKFFFTGSSPLLNVWVKEGVNELDVYRPLEHQGVSNHYRILEAAESKAWHYENNPRISRITLLADDHYVFQDFYEFIDSFKEKKYKDLTDTHGEHGYPTTTTNMEPIFVAVGPSFHRGFKAPNFSNIDVYPLLCRMLSLPAGPHNGSFAAIAPVLAQPSTTRLLKPLIIALACMVLLVGVVGMVACALTRRSHKRTVSADSLINGYVYRKTMRKEKPLEDRSEEECLLEPEVEEV